MKMFLLLLTILCSLSASAGKIEDRTDGKTVIHVTVFSLPDPNATNTFSRANLETVKLFKKRFPQIFAEKYAAKYMADPGKYGKHNWNNVEIQLHAFSGITVTGVETDLLAIAGGMAPDILYINFRKSDNYISNGFLYPLDEYFKTLSKDELDFRIHPRLWQVIKRKGPDGKIHDWTLPYGGALGKLLMFRKDLFEKNNIPLPTLNWTWDDMMAAAKKITDPEKGTYGILTYCGGYFFTSFLWSAGGDIMLYDEPKDEWRCTFNTPEVATALDYFIRLNTEKWKGVDGTIYRGYSSQVNTDYSSTQNKWDKGEIGMRLAYIDEKSYASINPELVGIMPVPFGPTGKRGSELNSMMFGLCSQIKEDAVRDAAWEYMIFTDSKEAMALRTKILVEGGMANFVNPKFLTMFGYPELVKYAPKGYDEIYKIAFETGQPEPYGKNSNFAYQMLDIPIRQAAALSFDDKLPEDRAERLKILQGILDDACSRANEVMIGKISPEETMKRRSVAAVVLLAIVITFGFVIRKIFKLFTPPQTAGKQMPWGFRKYWVSYLLLLPAVGSIIVWSYTPIVQGSAMAFYNYKIIGSSIFIGLDNFGNLLFDGFWWSAVWNSIRYCFIVLSLTFIPPIALAVLLQEVPKAKIVFRIIYYLPAMITGIVTVLLWKQFFDPSRYGMLNMVVMKIPAIGFIGIGAVFLVIALMFASRLRFYEFYFGMGIFIFFGLMLFGAFASIALPILFPVRGEALTSVAINFLPRLFGTLNEPMRWLEDQNTSMISCVIPMVWAGMGPGSLIYLAALKGIPDDYYEAADIDGATFIDKLLFVVFPFLKTLIIINFVGAFIGAWYSGAGNILVLTGGGANTEVADLHIWYKAFTYLNFGQATAMAWMLGLMLIGFTIYQLRILSKIEFRATGKT